MDAIKKKMQAMKAEKDNAMDRADTCEQQSRDANLRAEKVRSEIFTTKWWKNDDVDTFPVYMCAIIVAKLTSINGMKMNHPVRGRGTRSPEKDAAVGEWPGSGPGKSFGRQLQTGRERQSPPNRKFLFNI